jgi:ATP-dependent DNA helicase RecG
MEDSAFKTSLSDEIMLKAGLCTPAFAYRAIHCPKSFEDTEKARRFFVFEELYNFALRVKHSKVRMREGSAEPLKVSKSSFAEFTSQFSYELTNAQKKAINEIAVDLASGKPMRRMLCGDVGSGKTAVAAAAAYIAIKSGHKAALMAPTEILACQHYADLSRIFEKIGISCALFVGSNSQKTKKELYQALKEGKIDFAIGTHALLSDGVEFNDCALVITDEQHRFGVNQRDTLEKKRNESQGEDADKKVHTLVMSATPIPRSLAQTVYGDLDLSILDELPPGRKTVDTFVVGSDYLIRLDKFIEKQVNSGSKVYVVCPAVEEKGGEESDEVIQFGYGYDAEQIANESLPIIGAVEEAERLKNALPNLNIGCVHGKMKSAEKDEVMKAFSADGLDVLVSTTVIEVGVNVPTATLMIVRCAERFGLSQLHQLRGRVGRGDRQSYCVLVSDTSSELSRERLNAIKSTSDGFMLAEHDLALRGPGDFIQSENGAIRQSGDFRFRFASITEDIELMKLAFELAE